MTYLTSAADGLVCLTARNVVSYISGHHVKFKFFVFLFSSFRREAEKKMKIPGSWSYPKSPRWQFSISYTFDIVSDWRRACLKKKEKGGSIDEKTLAR